MDDSSLWVCDCGQHFSSSTFISPSGKIKRQMSVNDTPSFHNLCTLTAEKPLVMIRIRIWILGLLRYARGRNGPSMSLNVVVLRRCLLCFFMPLKRFIVDVYNCCLTSESNLMGKLQKSRLCHLLYFVVFIS